MTPAFDPDETLVALANPTRRAILARLAGGEARVTELADPFDMSLEAVSKHIRLLERARLVRRRRAGIGRWMFGRSLREEEVVRITLEAGMGGRFSFVVRRQGQEIDHIGRCLELDRPRRLAFTWAIAPEPDDGSRVVVELVPDGEGCTLTLTHELSPEWADCADRTRDAWAKMLGVLDTHLR